MSEDAELLRDYAETRSEASFAELVQRHFGLVYSVALRQVGGDAHLAEDVTQKVFTDLARKALPLSKHPVVSGWLYRSTQFAAIDMMRTEMRRRAREKEAQTMHEFSSSTVAAADLEKIRPVLDQAMGDLNERDRNVIMLRFFENRPFTEIGRRLRLTEDAARMRVERALEKMRSRLVRRGVTSTSVALATALTGQASAGAPSHLAASVASAAMSAATTGASTSVWVSLGTSSLMKASSLVLAGSLVANAIFAVVYAQNPQLWLTPTSLEQSRPTVAALSSFTPAVRAELTDAVEIGRRLRARGFSDEVVRFAVYVAVAETFGDATGVDYAERQARVRRWNPNPDLSRAVAPGLTAPPERFSRPQEAATQAAWAELGYDRSGNPVQMKYRNLSPRKAAAVNKIEEDYRAIREKGTLRVGSVGSITAETSNFIADQFEADIRAALSPAEAADYFRYNSDTGRQVQSVLGDLKISDQSYAAIADAALALERQNRASHGKREDIGRLTGLLATYRRELGDEQFLRLAARLPGGNIYLPLDPIYQAAKLSLPARADLLVAMISAVKTIQGADPEQRPALAAQALAEFTTGAGLNAGQIAAFDASRAGEFLKTLANLPRSGATPP